MLLEVCLLFALSISQVQSNGNRNEVGDMSLRLVTPKPPLKQSCHGHKHVIFSIPRPPQLAGGFGDRLRGLVTVFYHAILSNATYSVHWETPYDLNTYFVLESCDLAFDLTENSPYFERNTINNPNYYAEEGYLDDFGKNVIVNSNSLNWPKVVRNPRFSAHTAQLGINRYSSSQLFQVALDSILLSPQKILRHAMEMKMKEIHHKKYLGVHIRIGSGGSIQWEDPARDSLQSVPCFARQASQLAAHANLDTIFITSDSQEAVDLFKLLLPQMWMNTSHYNSVSPPLVFTNTGTIAHTDRSHLSDDEEEAWLKSVLDWWILKHATALVHSRSGFSETAAWSSHTLFTLPKSGTPLARTFAENCRFYNTFYNSHDAVFLGSGEYHISPHHLDRK